MPCHPSSPNSLQYDIPKFRQSSWYSLIFVDCCPGKRRKNDMVDVLVMEAVWDSENASVCEKNIIMPMDRCKLNCVTGTPTANLTIITFLFFSHIFGF